MWCLLLWLAGLAGQPKEQQRGGEWAGERELELAGPSCGLWPVGSELRAKS